MASAWVQMLHKGILGLLTPPLPQSWSASQLEIQSNCVFLSWHSVAMLPKPMMWEKWFASQDFEITVSRLAQQGAVNVQWMSNRIKMSSRLSGKGFQHHIYSKYFFKYPKYFFKYSKYFFKCPKYFFNRIRRQHLWFETIWSLHRSNSISWLRRHWLQQLCGIDKMSATGKEN